MALTALLLSEEEVDALRAVAEGVRLIRMAVTAHQRMFCPARYHRHLRDVGWQ